MNYTNTLSDPRFLADPHRLLYTRDYSTSTQIECLALDPKFLPQRQHATDAGADLVTAESRDIYPGEQRVIDCGVAVKIPQGYAGFVFNRSSQGKLGVTIPHGVGVIDSDYRGNIKVILKNMGTEPYIIKEGETRIAQLVIMPVMLADFVDMWNDTKRGTGGFGSTDK
jgi:dUTP pyrophosphatase